MTFYERIKAFQEDAERTQARIQSLIDDKQRGHEKIAALKREYNELLLSGSSASDTFKKKKDLERLTQDVSYMDERIQEVQQYRLEQLRAQLSELDQAKNEEWKKIAGEYDLMMVEARKKKAELLLYYCEINKKKQEFYTAYDRFMDAVYVSKLEDHDKLQALNYRRAHPCLPRYATVGTYTGMDLTVVPLEGESTHALNNAYVCAWVRLYEKTGEHVWKDSTAQKKLAELNGHE
ncbi:hypothetical protein [Heliophilum fasciatum]|uniref:Uncharacterized protein n=1 Tax=Heliophilum fasciatum TaxID=35700 RepID=A0A4R2RJY8_9FIRM|nr:hypothetical protein [Heliophilum fasciatum]MCW2279414.1 vacuolar-type H+-ATPase subunit I/STV1 [Heliophilum fasciatum]TCP59991.1 hypothetical protein EDD73_1434 [Heliophilum fasciatum]